MYIIKHDFNLSSIPYYVRFSHSNQDSFEEIYNPSFATPFTSKKEAENWVKTYSSMEEYSCIVEREPEIRKFTTWSHNGMPRRVLSCTNLSYSRPYNNESLDEVIDWWIWQTSHDDEIKYEHYKTWPELYSLSPHLMKVQGFLEDEKILITFEIYTSKKGKFEEFEKEINRVINKVTLKDENGYAVFPVFDHYLSEGGNSVSMLIHPESEDVIIRHRFKTLYPGLTFPSLEDGFKYLKKERYY